MTEDPRDVVPMDVELSADEDSFLAAVARPMRAPERLAPDFERRLLAAVRADAGAGAAAPTAGAGARRESWWRRQRVVRVSPLLGLAAAAGFAAVVSVATLAATSRGPAAAPAAPAPLAAAATAADDADTVHVVRFVLVEPDARRVALVGDFNGWSAEATELTPAGSPGTWAISVPLPPGRHEYAFIVEEPGGEVRWTRDPFAPPVRDDYGTESSVVTVGASVERRS